MWKSNVIVYNTYTKTCAFSVCLGMNKAPTSCSTGTSYLPRIANCSWMTGIWASVLAKLLWRVSKSFWLSLSSVSVWGDFFSLSTHSTYKQIQHKVRFAFYYIHSSLTFISAMLTGSSLHLHVLYPKTCPNMHDIVTLAGFVKSQQSIKCPLRLQVFRGQKRQMKCHVTPENPNTTDYKTH